jgi:2-keto-4-pentenoate hydratase
MKSLKQLLLWITLATSTGLFAGELELADQLWQSHRNNQRIPVVSSTHPELSVEQAYIVQAHYVKKRLAGEKPAGFKAGLTSAAGQKKFHLNQALAGVLFATGDLRATESIQLSQFKRLMLETELGFEIGTAITGSIANTAALKPYINTVFPVIELPDIGFVAKPTGVDIIAANVGAAAFIKGRPFINWTELDLNALKVTLTRNGKTVNVGQSNDALGNQWEAALWLVNTIVAQGWTLEPGQFFITGALGKMIKAQAGDYKADFGPLGEISFSMVP